MKTDRILGAKWGARFCASAVVLLCAALLTGARGAASVVEPRVAAVCSDLGSASGSATVAPAPAQPDTNRLDAKGRKQGLWVRQDTTRRLFYRGVFKDDRPQGRFIYTDHEGVVVSEAFYFRDGYASFNRFFYPDGKLLSEGYYLDKQKDSLWIFYRENGKKIRSVTYKNGQQDGMARLYDENEKVMEEMPWFRGLRQGAWWKREAQGYQSGFYLLNQSDGPYHAFYPDSSRYITGHYDKGNKHGLWSFYLPAPSKRLYKEEDYVQNKLMARRLFLQIEGVLRPIATDTIAAVLKSPDGMGDVFTQSGGRLHSDESFENVTQIMGQDLFYQAHESAWVAYKFTKSLRDENGMKAVVLSVKLPFTIYADEKAIENLNSMWNRAAVPAEDAVEAAKKEGARE